MVYYPILIMEIMLTMCRTTRSYYIFFLGGLFNITQAIYAAFFVLNWVAFLVVLLIYIPYVVSLCRMVKRDSETARMLFYSQCLRMWILALAIDIWIHRATVPVVDNLCHFYDITGDEAQQVSDELEEYQNGRTLMD